MSARSDIAAGDLFARPDAGVYRGTRCRPSVDRGTSLRRACPRNRMLLGAALFLVLAQLAILALTSRNSQAAPIPPGAPGLRIDPNRATPAELDLLPGVGPVLAQYIVSYREEAHDWPAFRSANDLDRVPRIGPALVERLRPFLTFPGDADTP